MTIIRSNLNLRAVKIFVAAKFYCLHALADGSQRIQIRELSSTVLSTLSPN